MGLFNKDIRLCLEEADALGVPMIVGNAVRQLYSIALASEGPSADMTEVVKPVERWAGATVGPLNVRNFGGDLKTDLVIRTAGQWVVGQIHWTLDMDN